MFYLDRSEEPLSSHTKDNKSLLFIGDSNEECQNMSVEDYTISFTKVYFGGIKAWDKDIKK